MRSLVVMAMFAASLSNAAWNGYTEDRNLSLDARDVDSLEIESGAGSVIVNGAAGIDAIEVKATIKVPVQDTDKAQQIIATDLQLSLTKDRGRASLNAYFEDPSWKWGDGPLVDLIIRVPTNLALMIDDGSGLIEVRDVEGDVEIDDGSGSIELGQVGAVVIDDGSGSISIVGVQRNVSIEDGSGSITVRHVGGSVAIDDGSGSITVDDVDHDLIIVDDGSGDLNFSNIGGTIEQDT